MTREEAIAILQEKYDYCKSFYDLAARPKEDYAETAQYLQALQVALSALRPVSREQVEKVFPGCEKCRNQANWPSWIEKGFVYCPKCGTPLTSWAWEKQMKRLEALKDGKDRSI